MTKWQYLVMQAQVKRPIGFGLPDDFGVRLDEYGAEGWEMVKVEPIVRKGVLGGSFTDSFVLFFRRPLPQ